MMCPMFEAEDGKTYLRRNASNEQLDPEDIAQITRGRLEEERKRRDKTQS